MRFFKKDIKKCAQDCYVYILADDKLFKQLIESDGAALRKYFTSWLMKAPDAPVTPQLQQVEPEPVEQGPPPLTGEERLKRLKEWEAMVLATADNFRAVPHVTKEQIKEEGQTDKPKAPVYRSDQDDFLYHLRNNIKKFAAKKYKGYYKWDGFKHYQIGLVTVYAESMNDAQEILKSSERLTTLQQRKKIC